MQRYPLAPRNTIWSSQASALKGHPWLKTTGCPSPQSRERVILDADLAALYGVSTKRLNEQVKRNRSRFPAAFMFQLTADEKAEGVANCDHLRRLKFSPNLPYVFTQHGTIMGANVLNSERAVHATVAVVRAFIRLREMISSNPELSRRLDDLEGKYDCQFKVVFDAI